MATWARVAATTLLLSRWYQLSDCKSVSEDGALRRMRSRRVAAWPSRWLGDWLLRMVPLSFAASAALQLKVVFRWPMVPQSPARDVRIVYACARRTLAWTKLQRRPRSRVALARPPPLSRVCHAGVFLAQTTFQRRPRSRRISHGPSMALKVMHKASLPAHHRIQGGRD